MTDRKVYLQQLLDSVQDLPPLPQAAMKILHLIEDPDSTMAQLAQVLRLDEALLGRVLTWANSPFYGGLSKVHTAEQAMMRLGMSTLRQLVLTTSTINLLGRPLRGYAMIRGELWRHSIAVAAGARHVMAQHSRNMQDQAYVAGLLHDVGKLVFDAFVQQTDFWDLSEQNGDGRDGPSFDEIEADLLGMDHAQLGAEVGRRWNLPDDLVEAIAYHHEPSRASADGKLLAAAVHVADAAALMAGLGLGIDGLDYWLDVAALEAIGWAPVDMETLMTEEYRAVSWAEEFMSEGR